MAYVSITVTGVEEWQRYFENVEISSYVGDKLEEVCQDIVATAQANAPRKTGEYAAGIGYERVDRLRFLIKATAPHSAIVEGGSRPHFILPRTKKVLRWLSDGEVVFAKWAMHPGTIGQHILHNAKKAHLYRIAEVVREGVREAIGK